MCPGGGPVLIAVQRQLSQSVVKPVTYTVTSPVTSASSAPTVMQALTVLQQIPVTGMATAIATGNTYTVTSANAGAVMVTSDPQENGAHSEVKGELPLTTLSWHP